MPVQTTKKSNIYYPDGAMVSVKKTSSDPWFDVGAIQSAVNNSVDWEENVVDTANAGRLATQIRNMTISGGFELINLDPEGISILGGGIFEAVETPGGAVTLDNQVLSSIVLDVQYDVVTLVSGASVKVVPPLVITSMTASVAGVLAEGVDYLVTPDDNSSSGFSVAFISGGASGIVAGENVTIVFGANTAVESTTVYMGSSTQVLSAYAMRITHTDDNGKIRQLELFSVDATSGGFQFNFKGANEDGTESMPLTYVAKLDTTKVSGRQLAGWTVQSGAM